MHKLQILPPLFFLLIVWGFFGSFPTVVVAFFLADDLGSAAGFLGRLLTLPDSRPLPDGPNDDDDDASLSFAPFLEVPIKKFQVCITMTSGYVKRMSILTWLSTCSGF